MTECSVDRSPLLLAARIVRGADRILTGLLIVLLTMILAYACFALWDTWRIYNGAGVDESLLQYKPELNADNGDSFEELMALNPDVCAWLSIEGTHIDYPVVQGTDNVTYVNTDVYGAFSLSGSIFLDYRNAPDFTDSYSLIYGHHMDGEVMFGELAYFLEQAYFEEYPTGFLYLPERTCIPTWMSVKQLMDFYGDFYADFRAEAAEEMLSHLNIRHDQRIKQMSKGTREKVQLIMVMSRAAKLYLLDEPIGGVDPATRDYILSTIIGNYNPEAAVVLSTHLIADVEKILDEVIFINQGRVMLQSSVDQIREEKGMSVDALFREVFRC